MFISKDDFRLKAAHFDLSRGSNLLRVMAGAFMFPHVAGKFAHGALNPAIVGFFAKAGFAPAEWWVGLAALTETAVGVALILGLCTRFAALGGAAALAVAVYALQVVKGFSGWTWNTGGYEYPVFWALVCVAIALDEFRRVGVIGGAQPADGRGALKPSRA